MKKYEILHKIVMCETYEVKANSKKEALDKFDDRLEDGAFELPDEICDSSTKIISWSKCEDDDEDDDWDDDDWDDDEEDEDDDDLFD